MKLKRVLACLVASTMVAALPVDAYAAQHDVTSAQDVTDVIDGMVADTDDEITFDLQNDIDCAGEEWNTRTGKTYIINGNDHSLTDVAVGGEGTVTINADVKGTMESQAALDTEDSVDVTVNGDVYSLNDGVLANDNSEVTVNGDVTTVTIVFYENGTYAGDNYTMDVVANDDSKVTINGNLNGAINDCDESAKYNVITGVLANDNSQVTVDGDVTDVYDGIYAHDNATVNLTGNMTLNMSYNNGVFADGSSEVTVGGDIVSGFYGVFASGEASTITVGGDVSGLRSVYAEGKAKVTIDGNVTASLGDKDLSYCCPIEAYGESNVTVGGTVTGGDPISVYSNATVTILNNGAAMTILRNEENDSYINSDTCDLDLLIDADLPAGTSTAQPVADIDIAFSEQTDVSSPKTGDDNMIGAWAVIGVAAVAVAVASKRKRNA